MHSSFMHSGYSLSLGIGKLSMQSRETNTQEYKSSPLLLLGYG